MKVDISRSTFLRQNQFRSVRLQQGRVLLDADWNEQIDIDAMRDRILTRDVVGLCGVPEATGGFFIVRADDLTPDQEARYTDLGLLPLDDGDFLITQGRIYVWGLMTETSLPTTYLTQPYLPEPPLPDAEGIYVAYLDIWERSITALEHPDLREPALGGADTTTREQTLWQVRLERVGDPGDSVTCSDFGSAWLPTDALSTGRLQARVAEPGETLDSNCMAASGGGYFGLENQLYRVEVHRSTGGADGASFVWSRDNGSIATELRDIVPADRIVVLADAGADSMLGFTGAAWIELSDQARVLSGRPGVLLEVERVQGDEVRVRELPAGLDMADFGPGATVRRWDGAADIETGDFLELEDGVEIQFEAGGHYGTGDYWLIPARSLEGRILWPMNGAGPAFVPRHGPEHRYCVLGIGSFNGTDWGPFTDCRDLFPELTNLPTTSDREAGIRIMGAQIQSPDGERLPLQNDSLVRADLLGEGITVQLDGSADRSSLEGKPVMSLTLDMPWPFRGEDQQFFGSEAVVGFTPLRIDGDATAAEDVIRWAPSRDAARWLSQPLFGMMREMDRGDRVLARLTLEGNFVWSFPDGSRYVDGETYGRTSEDGRTALALERGSGDGRRGGDFRMWFWLVAPEAEPVGLVIDARAVDTRIVGRVTDTNGSPIPGAEVTARHVESGATRAATTNASGNFTFVELPRGRHVLTASIAGFESASITVVVRPSPGPGGPVIPLPTDPVVVFPGGPTGPNIPPGGPTGPITGPIVGPGGPIGPGPLGPGLAAAGAGAGALGPRVSGGLQPGDLGLRLEDVSGIGTATAEKLIDAGITHPAMLVDVDPATLADRAGIAASRAKAIVARSGELFG